MSDDQDIDFDALYDRIKAFKISGHDLYVRGFEDGKKVAIDLLKNYFREKAEMSKEIFKCCKTCQYSARDSVFAEDLYCANDQSKHVADWVKNTDCCECWVERKKYERRKR